MVEVILEMSEDELKDLVNKEFKKLSSVDSGDEELYINYFNSIIEDGSATLFYGPVHLKTWVLDTMYRLSVISPSDDEYSQVKDLWESREYESNSFAVVGHSKSNYLVEYF